MNKIPVFKKDDLIYFKPQHKSFVGIDSDGCVFPTMEIKQKQCFHTVIIEHWGLQKIEPYVRETAEFVNLYSLHRGQNRFPCLCLVFDLLGNRPEVIHSGVKLPDLTSLKAFIDSGLPLAHPALESQAKATNDPALASVLQWSLAVNETIAQTVKNVPPFPFARESLEKINTQSDAICVSQTPTEALVREWEENQLMGFVKVIAGQELGTKTDHLRMATEQRYRPEKVLMIGDALGDLNAALGVKACFFPINPGHEADSWELFYTEAYDQFLNGTYIGTYEHKLIAEFRQLLPETPPWKATGRERM